MAHISKGPNHSEPHNNDTLVGEVPASLSEANDKKKRRRILMIGLYVFACAVIAFTSTLLVAQYYKEQKPCPKIPYDTKPRPTRPAWSPNQTTQLPNCTEGYDQAYCLNTGSCTYTEFKGRYAVWCRCAQGWLGRRCEYFDLGKDIRFPFMRQRVESASVSLGVCVLVLVTFLITLGANLYKRRRQPRSLSSQYCCKNECAICQNSSPMSYSISHGCRSPPQSKKNCERNSQAMCNEFVV